MSKVKFITIFIALLFLQVNFCHSQSVTDSLETQKSFTSIKKRSGLHTSLGCGGFWFTFNLYYDRILFEFGKNKQIKPAARIGLNTYAAWEGGGVYFTPQVGSIFGRNKNLIEAYCGFSVSDFMDIRRNSVPAISLAYRYQNPKKISYFGLDWVSRMPFLWV